MNLTILLQTVPTTLADSAVAAASDVQNVAVSQPEVTLSFWDMCLKGGWMMVPLALLFVLAVYIFIERLVVIIKANRENSMFTCSGRAACAPQSPWRGCRRGGAVR